MGILKEEKGLTLVEVVASIVILSISLLLFGSFFTQNYTLSKSQDNRMIAMNLARQTAEEWKSGTLEFTSTKMEVQGGAVIADHSRLNYQTLAPLVSSTPLTINLTEPQTLNGRSYIQSIEISDAGENDPENKIENNVMLLITVTVREANTPTSVLARLSTGITE
ncbi:type IV pilus modification PilV family protein [Aneurinibacillus sp. REN35]|uniref:type IV pilus modification PilV family protein n=1 Tax=Aneurinibacillus sp. REN35 TaxID=3237286 RepID=UPI0035287BC2